MGYNTGIIVLNDALGSIERNPQEFVENMRQAIGSFYHDTTSKDIAVGGHVNAASVFHMDHADCVGVHAIGGNHASRMLRRHNGGRHYGPEAQLELLKAMAEEMGYKLTKKKDQK